MTLESYLAHRYGKKNPGFMDNLVRQIDSYVEIEYDLKKNLSFVSKTNVKSHLIDKVLEQWARSQIGLGKDLRKPNEKDVYTIKIGIDLSRDAFYIDSDTGNQGLTLGIVMKTIGNWRKKNN